MNLPFDSQSAEAFYYKMLLIRRTEETLLYMFSKGLLNGTVHTCIGQEACSVGVIDALDREKDIVFSNHRAHGHFLAYFDDLRGLAAEILGKAIGVCGGIGGSQHIHKPNFFTNAIQGGIVPCAVGAALAEKMSGRNAIVVVFLGDGTMGQGVVYESFNIASLWKLPVLFVLEDNQYAQTTPKTAAHSGSLSARALPYGIESKSIEGFDVFSVNLAAKQAVEYTRMNCKPYFLHIETYRFGPHSKGDDYRDKREIELYREKDPLSILHHKIDPVKALWIHESVEARINATFSEVVEQSALDRHFLVDQMLDL